MSVLPIVKLKFQTQFQTEIETNDNNISVYVLERGLFLFCCTFKNFYQGKQSFIECLLCARHNAN